MAKEITSTESQWTKIILPNRGWLDINIPELWRYKDLIFLFVRRDFVAVYKQTVLGPLWYILQPLLTTLVFTVIFGKIAKISTDGLPPVLFYMSGTIAWNYFASCLKNTSTTFIANAGIFGKVYFPRLTVPVSVVISKLIAFALQFLCFSLLLGYFLLKGSSFTLTLWLLYVPLLIVHMAVLALGFGIIISSLTTKYRDFVFLIEFGVQLWMYATPVVYPLSTVPPQWQWLVALNPMAPIVETFRHAFLGTGTVNLAQLGLSISITLCILLTGIILFNHIEKSFMDTV